MPRNYIKKSGVGGRRPNGAPIDLQYFIDRSKVDRDTGCWNWSKAVSKTNGYATMRVGRKTVRVHRSIFEYVTGETLPSNIDVCHECDNRRCICPDHLFKGTRKENMEDCASKGRVRVPALRGDDCPNSKLTSAQVAEIRADSRSQRALGRLYGVDRGTIAAIRNGKTWRQP